MLRDKLEELVQVSLSAQRQDGGVGTGEIESSETSRRS